MFFWNPGQRGSNYLGEECSSYNDGRGVRAQTPPSPIFQTLDESFLLRAHCQSKLHGQAQRQEKVGRSSTLTSPSQCAGDFPDLSMESHILGNISLGKIRMVGHYNFRTCMGTLRLLLDDSDDFK